MGNIPSSNILIDSMLNILLPGTINYDDKPDADDMCKRLSHAIFMILPQCSMHWKTTEGLSIEFPDSQIFNKQLRDYTVVSPTRVQMWTTRLQVHGMITKMHEQIKLTKNAAIPFLHPSKISQLASIDAFIRLVGRLTAMKLMLHIETNDLQDYIFNPPASLLSQLTKIDKIRWSDTEKAVNNGALAKTIHGVKEMMCQRQAKMTAQAIASTLITLSPDVKVALQVMRAVQDLSIEPNGTVSSINLADIDKNVVPVRNSAVLHLQDVLKNIILANYDTMPFYVHGGVYVTPIISESFASKANISIDKK